MEDYKKRINTAANFCINILKQSNTNENHQIMADHLILSVATFTGIATAAAAQDKQLQLQILSAHSNAMPLTPLSTDMGTFWIGYTINSILLENPMSTWSLCRSFYESKGYQAQIPDIEKMVQEQAAKIGAPDVRLWDGQVNPYKDVLDAKKSYFSILTALSETQISKPELQIAFSFALVQYLGDTYAAFPHHMNPLQMAMETVLFYAHMDI